MVAIAPHHLVYASPNRFEYYHFGVGYCLISSRGNARSQREDKANIVPTPYFILMAFFWGLEGTTTIKYAYNCNYFLCVHVLDE